MLHDAASITGELFHQSQDQQQLARAVRWISHAGFGTHCVSGAIMRTVLSSLGALCIGVILVPDAVAVPSYARQTGLACNACHYNPPELNAAGRAFKLMGY